MLSARMTKIAAVAVVAGMAIPVVAMPIMHKHLSKLSKTPAKLSAVTPKKTLSTSLHHHTLLHHKTSLHHSTLLHHTTLHSLHSKKTSLLTSKHKLSSSSLKLSHVTK